MHGRIDSESLQAVQIQLLRIGRRRLHDDLELEVMLQTVGVVAVTAVGGTTRRLHVGGLPGFGSDNTQERGGVEGTRTAFQIHRLHHGAALSGPVILQGQNNILKIHVVLLKFANGAIGLASHARRRTEKIPLSPVRAAIWT